MDISLRQLRAFVTVADAGGFTEAARRLHLTQPAISVLVKELEAQLGLRLFNRTTRRVELTDAGREFHPRALQVLDDLRSAVRDAADLRLLRRGVVRVCAPQVVACSLLAPAIAEYEQRQPAVEVRLVDALVAGMLAPLAAGEVDCVIGPLLPAAGPEAALLQRTPLFDSRFVACCRPDHPLAAAPQRSIRWRELLAHRLVVAALDFEARIVPQLRRHLGDRVVDDALGATLAAARPVANITTGLGLAEAGLGVAIAPAYIAPLARAFGLVVKPLGQPVMTRTVALYTRRQRELPPAAADFVAYVREHLSARAAPSHKRKGSAKDPFPARSRGSPT